MITLTNGNDRYVGDGSIEGLLGNDRITATSGSDLNQFFGDYAGSLGAGKGGNDWLTGAENQDSLIGDAASLLGTGRGGNDHLDGGAGADFLYGDAYEMDDSSKGGNDQLAGGDGGDFLVGDAGAMVDSSVGGNDQVAGGAGDDWLAGDADLMFSLDDAPVVGGADQLDGGTGNDQLVGDADLMFYSAAGGDDRLRGGEGDDSLYGDFRQAGFYVGGSGQSAIDLRGGNDVLDGGAGNDSLWGDFGIIDGPPPQVETRGADLFVFANGSGQDIIFDFDDGVGPQDRIDVSAYEKSGGGKLSWVDLAANISGNLIDLGAAAGGIAGQDTVTVNFYQGIGSLDASDFAFG